MSKDDFFRDQLCHHPNMDHRVTLYIFENWAPHMEVMGLKHKVEGNTKVIDHS